MTQGESPKSQNPLRRIRISSTFCWLIKHEHRCVEVFAENIYNYGTDWIPAWIWRLRSRNSFEMKEVAAPLEYHFRRTFHI